MNNELTKPDKTPTIPSPSGDASRSVPRVDPAILRGSPPSAHALSCEKSRKVNGNAIIRFNQNE